MESMIDHVIMEVPQFAAIRKALMKPVVQFAMIEAKSAEEFKDYIQSQLYSKKSEESSWFMAAVGLTGRIEAGGMASLSQSHNGKPWITTFGPALNEQNSIFGCAKLFSLVFPSADLQSFLGAHDNELWIGVLPGGRATDSDTASSEGEITLTKLNFEFPAQLKPLSFGDAQVLTAKQSGANIQVYTVAIKKDAIPEPVIDLPSGIEWKHWDAYPANSTLVVAGSSASGGSRIEFVQLSRESDSHPDQRQQEAEAFQPRSHSMQLPGISEIVQVQALGPKQCVFTDTSGRLFYMDETRHEPMPLKHQDLPKNIERILSNKGGWLALIANSRISMWNCRRGGFIYPYDGEALKADVILDNYSVSAKGRYLYNFVDTLIFRWSFPKSAGDRN